MRHRTKSTIPALLTLATLLMLPLSGVLAQTGASPAITIGHRDSVTSTVLGERREILVYTPPSYRDTTYLPRQYPVLYLLDGDAHFHAMTGLIQHLGTGVNGVFVVPEMIVVAIPNTDRNRDLTPTHVESLTEGKPAPEMKTSGGMPAFLQFLKTELIPYVDSTYRTMPYRVFVGHSLGGITAINALYTMPELFNGYVAIDPSLWWDNNTLLRQARERLSSPGLSGRALYVAQANTINAADTISNRHFNSIVQFNSVAESYNQSGLRYGYRYYPNDDHGSVPLIAEYDALRFIFADYKGDLERYVERPNAVTERFARLSESLGVRFDPPEPMVDLFANFAKGRDTTKALVLFRLNTELYPSSPHAWASLGNAQAAQGDTVPAIASFRRVLTLRPGDAGAAEMLRKLGAGAP